MTFYRGMALQRGVTGRGIWIYAQDVADARAWPGQGSLGTMPDLRSAKAYVDWLHAVGPDAAPATRVEGEVRHGHAVFVRGGEPDGHARLLDHLGEIAALLEASVDDRSLEGRSFSSLTWCIRALEIAADAKGGVEAIGNFFVSSGASPRDGFFSLHLGNFGLPGDWNGSGRVALGVGRGWVGALAGYLTGKPIERYRECGAVSADAPDGYGRTVFVEGPEPVLSAEELGALKTCESNVSVVRGYGPNYADDRRRYILGAADVIRGVAEAVKSRQAGPQVEDAVAPTMP
jgi:hypothetical protein